MKKILLFIVALVATLSMNAQTTEIYKGDTLQKAYYGADVTVSFGEKSIRIKQGSSDLSFFGSNYKVVSKELPPSTGTAKRKGNYDVNWVQLWKDGPKFAEYNVGASSATDYGDYLAWGGSTNKDATYNTGSAVLSGSDDSAYKVWGEHWRMPTKDELDALIDNCNVKWTNSYNDTGTAGKIYTGKGDYASNSIFLPAAGRYESGNVVGLLGNGNYWSSTSDGSTGARSLYFDSGSQRGNIGNRRVGYSVRPIYVEDLVAVTGVSLNKTELKVGVGNTETLSATVAPADATNKKVLWASSDESIATVDAYGKVTGVKVGKCDITATTEDGGKTATCAVEVVTTGTAKARINGMDVDVKWIQLWENGPKFAEYNVGAISATDYGGHYCWGGTYKNGKSITWRDDHDTGSSELSHTGNDITDTATNLWGSNWRMPTQTELQGLIDSCDVAWTTVGGKNGCKFTGRGAYSSNSVFLPAVGRSCSTGTDTPGGDGNYWSSTPDASNSERAYSLEFFFVNQHVSQGVYSWYRKYGESVRAVLAK